jgi:UDP-glucose 4-epimerase
MLLDAARRAGVRRIVYAASSSAYGDTATLPKSEDMLPQPLSPYAATKLACEYYMLVFARCYQLDTVALRYFNIFGPRQDPGSTYSGVIARFCLAFAEDLPLTVFGDGEQSRYFTYVDNAVEANLLAARAPERLGGAVLNVGCGERWSLNQMIRALVEITGESRSVTYEPPRAGDVRHSQADLAQIHRRLGHQPVVPFAEGLRRTFEWYKRQAPSNAADRKYPA